MPEIAEQLSILYPLSDFYEQSGLALPATTRLEGYDMPEPYRSLLVHEQDMTSTLEAAYHRKMNLRVLQYSHEGDIFSRHIVLEPEGRDMPVIFGAIKIYLDEFPASARDLILERKIPFGSILQTEKIRYFSRPDAFFEIEPDAQIQKALKLDALKLNSTGPLYGRRNVMWTIGDRKLAHILEILPPH